MTDVFNEKSIISRICFLREKYAGKRGKALFANALGLSPSTYNYYEQDRLPPIGVLWSICRLTGADIQWLLTGQSGKNADLPSDAIPINLHNKIKALLQNDPQSALVMEAFVDLLQQKTDFEKPLPHAVNFSDLRKPSWLPILGRTAAGMVHFWRQNDRTPPDITELAQIINKHQQRQYQKHDPDDIYTDFPLPDIAPLDISSVIIVQLTEVEDDGISEYIECPDIVTRYPDAFALRVDGDSMAPRIKDGDIIVLSPSVPARDGASAVVKLCAQIGVTCKIIRRRGDQVHLIAVNENFDTRVYNLDQVAWALAVLWRIRLAK